MSKKVLVIDDSKTARREIVRLVHSAGLIAFEAENGRYGLEIIQKRNDIGLIFCDLNMPEMNGLEFLEALRRQDLHKETPVVMLSSEAAEETQKKAKDYNIKGWIFKPANASSVKNLLELFCS